MDGRLSPSEYHSGGSLKRVRTHGPAASTSANRDEQSAALGSGKQMWLLHPADVPSTAKKIYCIRRGRTPGFYFEWQGSGQAQEQVTGFPDELFISFPKGKRKSPIKPQELVNVVRDAVDYMNHDSTSCSYGCGGKCHRTVESTTPQPALPVPFVSEAPKVKNRGLVLCRVCGLVPPVHLARVCRQCLQSLDLSSKLALVIREFKLNAEQAHVLDSVAQGRNVFFTGAAGTGKSRVLQALVAYLKYAGLVGEVVAPTGMAALGVYGRTIHQYAGWDIKLGKASLDELAKLSGRKRVWDRFYNTDVLIIDEISMVEADMLTRLSSMMQHALQYSAAEKLPFGGVQVVIAGDFFQLPSVRPFETCLACGEDLIRAHRGSAVYTCREHGDSHEDDKWPFRSATWKASQFHNIELKQVHRQSDPVLTRLLHDMRGGQGWSVAQEDLILNHAHNVVFDDALKLMPRKDDVRDINDAHMMKLSSPARTYQSVDNIQWERKHPEFIDLSQPDGMSNEPFASLQRHMYESELVLKEGMQVILLANLDLEAGLANGSTGKVIDFTNIPHNAPSRKYRDYVEGQCSAFAKMAADHNEDNLWPVVQFRNGVVRTIYPHCSYYELGKEKPFSLLSRTQIPLIMGWALTIHKSQGMTLDYVVVSLDRCFEPGQAYVAMSRSRSLEALSVQTLPKPSMLIPDQNVLQFMKETFGNEWTAY